MRIGLPSTSMANANELFIVSYNMHGYNQGIESVKDLINSSHYQYGECQ